MNLLRSLFTSKKFLAMLSGLIVILALKLFKVEIDSATVAELVGLIASYIIGQSVADQGKEAAKINAISNAAISGGNVDAHNAVTAIAASMTPPTGSVTE